MKKLFKLFLLAGSGILSISIASALSTKKAETTVSVSAAAGDYYSAIDTSSPTSILNGLKKGNGTCGIRSVGYDGLWSAYKTTDVKSNGKICDMYSNITNFTPGTDQDKGSHKNEGDKYNREHTIPKSWWGGGTDNQGNDLFVVYPTDAKVNEVRSNYPYGEVGTASYSSKNNYSKLGSSKNNKYGGTVFEPADEWKGDIARIYFYVVATYNTTSWTNSEGAVVFQKTVTSPCYGLTTYASDLFMKWHLQDPVSDWERQRNEKVYNKQGNRNPFIDHPEWANQIWGDGIDTNVHPESVTIEGPTKIGVGQETTLKAVITPSNATNKSLTWSSSNSDVAIVSSGLITARAVGNARITATAKDGSNKSAYIDIEVTPVLVTKITLLPTSKTIEVGDTFTLTKTIAPSNATNKEVEWESSNSSVATISGGVVTAVGTGTATITATAKDGSGCKATCSVTVNAKPIKVTSITLSDTSINLTKGSTKALTATVSPSNATEQGVTWSSNSSTVASVSTSGLVTAKKTGTATITATAKDGSGIKTTCTVKVTTPVTGISLNKATLSLNKGASETLTATIAPSDADNKNVTWSGSANGITVDSSGKVTVLSTATAGKTATIVATSAEDSSIKAQCVVTVSDAPLKDAWTIMIYMCGADLESKNGLASGDIAEILSVSGQPDNVNIVIQTGGAASWEATYGISSSYNQRYHVQNKKLVCDNSKVYSSYKSMGESSTLADFVEWGITKYPAEKTGLIFWNHGGAMFGCCYDEKKDDDTIINSEAVSAFETAFTKTKTSKLEFVGYDCCLMQVQDIAEFNSEYFNYMVASEESESGYGWDYDTWIDDLYANKPTETILTSIVDGFIYENNYVYYTDGSREYDPSSNDQTLSWLDLSKATAYKNAFETFASALLTKISSVNKSTFSNWVINNVKHFAGNDYDYFALFDAYNFINKIKSNSSYNPGGTYAQDALTAFSNLVKYSNKGQAAGNAYGLGLIYACTESDPRYYSVSDFYLSSETNFTNWRNFNLSKGYLVDYD